MANSRLTMQARELYRAEENVIAGLRQHYSDPSQAAEIVETSYDLQSGSYTRLYDEDAEYRNTSLALMQRVAGILSTHDIRSACEAGTGEATKLAQLGQIAGPRVALSGFDISLGRMLLARKFLSRLNVEAECFCADMNDIPLPDNSVEAVMTFGAVEPNRGKEAKILGELSRVASKLLVLVEPDYDRGTPAQRARMDQHNYVQHLPQHLEKLPGKLLLSEPLDLFRTETHLYQLLVFEKSPARAAGGFELVSPVNRRPLQKMGDYFYCRDESLLYPAPFGIPVMKEDCAVICSNADQV
ncbi:MAG: class I SAM-dependent methyltransferase [Xanthobacteraceae bacterium]|nr:class I SAM-dependent methyltransferase [Xanthobacteraceae bacterium]